MLSSIIELESQKAFYWIRIDSIRFYSIEYGPTWEHLGFVLSYSIEYEKHWVAAKIRLNNLDRIYTGINSV